MLLYSILCGFLFWSFVIGFFFSIIYFSLFVLKIGTKLLVPFLIGKAVMTYGLLYWLLQHKQLHVFGFVAGCVLALFGISGVFLIRARSTKV